ncbi:MAG TPA: complex I NDUFA9 subunit family protein [Burkholderiales bacterium]
MRAQDVLVVGGAGFVGRHLVSALAARGARVTVPTRRRERAKHLLPLPTVEVVEADVAQPGVLAQLAAGRDVVVNLVGVLHSRRGRRDERGPNDYGPDFARAHVELAQAVVNACHAGGVKRLLHMSALGADPQGPSEYLRSKGIGEGVALAAEDIAVTVFRPSVIFGPEDSFLNLFATLARLMPVIVLACPDARFQPVYVGDVARAFLAALDDRGSHGKRYDLGGPRQYTLRELVQAVCAIIGRRRLVIGLGPRLSMLQARMLELSPVKLMTRDNVRSMQVPSVCAAPFPFGIEPAALEALAPAWLAPVRSRERFPALRTHARR